MLDYIERSGESAKLARKLVLYDIRLKAAKTAFYVCIGAAALIYALGVAFPWG